MTPYVAALLELRKDHDLWPWIDVSAAFQDVNGTGALAGLVATPDQPSKRAYDVLFDRMPFIWQGYGDDGVQTHVFNLDGSTDNQPQNQGCTFSWTLGLGGNFQQENQQRVPVNVRQICGNLDDEWVPLIGGKRIPAKETMQWRATYLGPTITTMGAAIAALGLRGYRTHPKGQTDPPQLTRREWLQRGAVLEAFTYNKTMPVDLNLANTGAIASDVLPFDKAFLIHSIRVALAGQVLDVAGVPAVYSKAVRNAVQGLQISITRTSTSPKQKRSFSSGLGTLVGAGNRIPSDFFPMLFTEQSPVRQQLTPLLPDYTSSPANAWSLAWKFPIPVTVPEFDVYALKVAPILPGVGPVPVPDPPVVPIEFVFEGELIHEDPSKPRLVTGRARPHVS